MRDDGAADIPAPAAGAVPAPAEGALTAPGAGAGQADEAWYVAFVLTGREEQVKHQLTRAFPDLTALVPRRVLREREKGRWRTVEKTVFPGYVFFRVALTNELYFNIKRVYQVIRILEQNRQPQPVAEHEMRLLLRLTEKQGLISFSRVSEADGKVVVVSGPLLGCEGLIIGSDRRKGRVRIRLCINGLSKVIDVGAEWIAESE